MKNKKYYTWLAICMILWLSSCAFFPMEEDDFLTAWGANEEEELPPAPSPRLPAPVYTNDIWECDGILRLPMRTPHTLNPLLNRDITVARILGLIFEPLAVLDEDMRAVGHLADLAFTLDFSSVVVTINNDAIWSDGLPVTADDLIFSMDTLTRAPLDAIYRSNIDNIAGLHRINDRTVQIDFFDASPAVGYALLFPLIPRHYYLGETNPSSSRNMSPLGNGIFLFESLAPLQSMTLRKNPYTFRSLANITQIEVLFLPDTQIDIYAFQRGLVDAIRMPFPEWSRIPTAKELHAVPFPAMYFEFIGFNITQERFRNQSIRQGIAHAFDACEAVETLYLHHAVRAAAPIHPYGWMFDPTVQGFAHDPNRARQLLHPMQGRTHTTTLSAQYEYEAPNLTSQEEEADGKEENDEESDPLIILVAKENPERVAIAHRLAAGLNDINHEAIVHAVHAEEFLTRLARDDYDLYIGWMELSYAPDVNFLFNGSRTAGVLFPYDPQLEALFTATRVATTESAFIQALSDFQHAFARNVPVIGLSFRHNALLMSARIVTEVAPAPNNIFLYVNDWKIYSN